MKKGLLILVSLLCLLFALSSCGECQHDWVVDSETAATCAVEGSKTSHCSKCEETKTETLAVVAHTLAKVAASDSTCAVAGCVEHYHCSVCEKNFSDAEGTTEVANVAKALEAHTIETFKKVAAKCVEDGNIKYYKCSACDKCFADADGAEEVTAESVVVKATGHKIALVDKVAPTYEEDGMQAYYKCSACKGTFSDEAGTTAVEVADLKIPMLVCDGHVYGDWTAASEGIYRACTKCEGKDFLQLVTDGAFKSEDERYTATIGEVTGEDGVYTFTVNAPVSGMYNLFFKGTSTEWKSITIHNESLGADAYKYAGIYTFEHTWTPNPDKLNGFGVYLKEGENNLKFKGDEKDPAPVVTGAVCVTAGETVVAANMSADFEKKGTEKFDVAAAAASLAAGKNAYYWGASLYFASAGNDGSVSCIMRANSGVYYANKLVITEAGSYAIGAMVEAYVTESYTFGVGSATISLIGDTTITLDTVNIGARASEDLAAGIAGYHGNDREASNYRELQTVYLGVGEYIVLAESSGDLMFSSVLATKLNHVHDWVETEDFAAGCNTYGYEYVGEGEGKAEYCSYCHIGKDENTKVLAPLDHDYEGATPIVTKATCEEDGVSSLVCNRCGASVDTVLPATDHNPSILHVVPATCSAEGKDLKICLTCGKTEEVVVEKINHNYGEPIVSAPKCAIDGKTVKVCKDCFYIDVTTQPATGHTFGEWTDVKANKYMIHTCSVCEATEVVAEMVNDKYEFTCAATVPVQAFEFGAYAATAGVYRVVFDTTAMKYADMTYCQAFNKAYPYMTDTNYPVSPDGAPYAFYVYLEKGANELVFEAPAASGRTVTVAGYTMELAKAADVVGYFDQVPNFTGSSEGDTMRWRLCGNKSGPFTADLGKLVIEEAGKYDISTIAQSFNGGEIYLTITDKDNNKIYVRSSGLAGEFSAAVGRGENKTDGYASMTFTDGFYLVEGGVLSNKTLVELAAGEYTLTATCQADVSGWQLVSFGGAFFFTRVADETEHEIVFHKGNAKTCSADGNIAYWECTKCGKLFSDYKFTTEVTLAETVLVAGHETVLVPAQNKTCTEDGIIAHYHCALCDGYWEDAEMTTPTTAAAVIDAHQGHSFTGEYVYNADFDCLACKCDNCTEYGKKDIAKKNAVATVAIDGETAANTVTIKVYAKDAGIYTFKFDDLVGSAAAYANLVNTAYPTMSSTNGLLAEAAPTYGFSAYLDEGMNTLTLKASTGKTLTVTTAKVEFAGKVDAKVVIADIEGLAKGKGKNVEQGFLYLTVGNAFNTEVGAINMGTVTVGSTGTYTISAFAGTWPNVDMVVKFKAGSDEAIVATVPYATLSARMAAAAQQSAGYCNNVYMAELVNVELETGKTYTVTVEVANRTTNGQLTLGGSLFLTEVPADELSATKAVTHELITKNAASKMFKVNAPKAGIYSFIFNGTGTAATLGAGYCGLCNQKYPYAYSINSIYNTQTDAKFWAYLDEGVNTLYLDQLDSVTLTGYTAEFVTAVDAVAYGSGSGNLNENNLNKWRLAGNGYTIDNSKLALGQVVIGETGFYSLSTFLAAWNGPALTVVLKDTVSGATVSFKATNPSADVSALAAKGFCTSDTYAGLFYDANFFAMNGETVTTSPYALIEAGTYDVTYVLDGGSQYRLLCLCGSAFLTNANATLLSATEETTVTLSASGVNSFDFKVYAPKAGVYTFKFDDLVGSANAYANLVNKAYPTMSSTNGLLTEAAPTYGFSAYLDEGMNTLTLKASTGKTFTVTTCKANFVKAVDAKAVIASISDLSKGACGEQGFQYLILGSGGYGDQGVITLGTLSVGANGTYAISAFACAWPNADLKVSFTAEGEAAVEATAYYSELSTQMGTIAQQASGYCNNLYMADLANVTLEAGKTYTVTVEAVNRSQWGQLTMGGSIFLTAVAD